MAVSPVPHFILASLVGKRICHLQQSENPLVQELSKGLARNLLHDHGQNRIARIAVLPLRARRKLAGGLLFEQLQHARIKNLRNLLFRRVGILLHENILVVRQSGSVVQQIANRDRLAVSGKLGEEVGEVIVVVKLAVPHQQHDAGCRELLGE